MRDELSEYRRLVAALDAQRSTLTLRRLAVWLAEPQQRLATLAVLCGAYCVGCILVFFSSLNYALSFCVVLFCLSLCVFVYANTSVCLSLCVCMYVCRCGGREERRCVARRVAHAPRRQAAHCETGAAEPHSLLYGTVYLFIHTCLYSFVFFFFLCKLLFLFACCFDIHQHHNIEHNNTNIATNIAQTDQAVGV